MRRAVIVAAVAATLAGGGAALATPGPNGHNDYGLCKAYSSGSQTGQDHKHAARPFVALEQAASDANQTVEEYCSTVTPGGK
jgi:hypothetical protein